MASKRAPSASWKFMEKISTNEVICLICKMTFKYKGATTTLTRHLQLKHPNEYDECKAEAEEAKRLKTLTTMQSTSTTVRQVQPTLAQTFQRISKYADNSDKKQMLDKLVTMMICTDMQPLSIVEDRGFRKLVSALDPKYVLPSRRDISRRLLPALYKEHQDILKKELNSTSTISVTTDIWTSRKTEAFLTVTAHFLNENWKLVSVVLETPKMTTAHTAANIADELKRVFDSWEIRGKVSCIVTDNASNMVQACNILKIRHMPCFAHTLNLVVQDAIKNTDEIADLKRKVKDIVRFFHHSVKATDKLSNLQTLQGKTVLKLKQDVETRWNSTYYMFQRFVEIHEFVTGALCSVGRHDLVVDVNQVESLKTNIKALEPFEMATREMSSENFTTLSKAMPVAKTLMTFLDETNRSTPSQLAQELISQMSRRFGGLESKFYLAAATLLDPRFKKLPFSDPSSCQPIETRLQGMMSVEEPQPSTSSTCATEMLQESPAETEKQSSSFWQRFDQAVEKTIATAARPITGPIIEFRRYHEESLIKRQDDPLLWWREREAIFPKLQELAKQFLSVPATSVPSERLFSKAGELISHRRSSLKESLVDKILFLNKNL